MIIVGIPRFDSKVVEDGDCLLWSASQNHQGYGKFWWQGKTITAHRFAYIQLVGPVPDGLQLDHTCHQRRCVNPEHLHCVTPKENIANGLHHAAQRTHCPRGHPYSHRNVNGDRCCRACNALTARLRRRHHDNSRN